MPVRSINRDPLGHCVSFTVETSMNVSLARGRFLIAACLVVPLSRFRLGATPSGGTREICLNPNLSVLIKEPGPPAWPDFYPVARIHLGVMRFIAFCISPL